MNFKLHHTHPVMKSLVLFAGLIPPALQAADSGPILAGNARGVVTSSTKEASLLLGNGDLGVMVRPKSGELGFVLGKADYWGVMNGSITNVGSFILKCPQLNGASFQLEQQIGPATVSGSFTTPQGVALALSTWVDKTDNLLVVELANTGNATLDLAGSLRTSRGEGIAANNGADAAGTWLRVGADAASLDLGNRRNWSTQYPFLGCMAGFALYNQALTPDQLARRPVPALVALKTDDRTILRGKAAWEPDAERGPVICFPDASSSVGLGDAQLPKAFTIDLWVKPTHSGKDATIFSAVNVETKDQSRYPFIRGFLLNVVGGKVRARLNCDMVESAEPLPLNQWTRVTATYGDCRLGLYRNGKPAGSVDTRPRDVLGWDKTAFRAGDPAVEHEGVAPLVMVRQRVIGPAPAVSGRSLGIKLEPGQKATWLVAAVTDRNSRDFETVSARLIEVDRADIKRRREAHQAAWKKFWGHSFVEIHDKKIQDAFYGALYLLACCSRPETPPPGLWYNFIPGVGMPWDGDYTLNYNFQAPFWAAYATNHFELADSYDNFLLSQIESGRAVARNAWRIDPDKQPGTMEQLTALRDASRKPDSCSYDGIFLYTHLIPTPGWSNDYGTFWGQKSNALFCAVNLIHRWRFDPDPAYAARVYPFLREVAFFWDSFLALEDGRYRVIGDAVGEGTGRDINPSTTLSYLRLLYPTVLEMSQLLNRDADRRAAWTEHFAKLSPFLFIPADGLGLRLKPETTGGRTVIRGCEKGPSFPKPMIEEYKIKRGERTSSSGQNTAQTIFPGLAFGLESPPEQLAAARDTVSLAAQWWDRNNTCSFYPAAAAVGHDPNEILENLRIFLDGTQAPNFTINTSGGGTETVAVVPATLAMMLVQSHQGVLHVFPNWPVTQDARFGGLNAQGGFLVSGSIKNGVIEPVTIQSKLGRECVLKNPWPGRAVKVLGQGRPVAKLGASDVLRFATLPNQTINLTPK